MFSACLTVARRATEKGFTCTGSSVVGSSVVVRLVPVRGSSGPHGGKSMSVGDLVSKEMLVTN